MIRVTLVLAAIVTTTIAPMLLALAQDKPALSGGPRFVEFAPKLTDEVLLNPHIGLYLPAGATWPPNTGQWYSSVIDIAYIRDDWAAIQPEETSDLNKFLDPIFDYWVRQGSRRVAFRFMSESMHSARKYVTPKWVFDKGVPSVQHVGLYTPEQFDPVFWDDRYLDIQCAFIKKLGQCLDGREGLEFVDIGSIGEWGEMHLARWTPQQLEQTGFTETKYALAYRRVIDAFMQAFPHTRVFLNIGGQNHLSIDDYMAIKGGHFRQDGLNPSGASYDCGTWLYKPYSRRGTVCNFEFFAGYDEMKQRGWDLKATIDKGLDAPISYLNSNLCDLTKAPDEVKTELLRAAKRIGYRFVMTKLQHPPQFHLDGKHPARVLLTSTWRNDGVAPCYDSFALEWTLADAAGKTVASEVMFPQKPTTQWWQGEEQTVGALMRVPANTPPGDYRLKVAMFLPETGQRILLGIAGRDAGKRYDLCDIKGAPGEAQSGTLYDEGFEAAPIAGAPTWNAIPGMTATIDDGAAHSGKRSLLIDGTCANVWNYATIRLPKVTPAAKYKLSAWMLVEKCSVKEPAPYLKLGANTAEGVWIDNYNTNAYDLTKPGTWQLLEGTADLPPTAGSADIAVERGSLETPITIRLRVDDVRVELLESP